MSKENSSQYWQGRDDGTLDAEALSACPPGMPLGPQPWNPKYPVMYMTGYNETFIPSPCDHTGSCKIARERQKAAQIVQNRFVGSHNTGQ